VSVTALGEMRSPRARGIAGSIALLAIVAGLFLLPRSEPSAPRDDLPPRLEALVTRVIDGDTVEVRIGGRSDEVRYIGVDTPETVKPGTPVQCYGPRSSRFNHRLVEGRRVRLVLGVERRDVYGRLLAYVYLGRRFVNAALVSRGLARTLTIPPNDRFAALLRRLERRAAIAGRGLWSECAP
jgi:micrococcal nuclease